MFAFIVLIVVVVAFAWNLGVHYTGAVMGMPYATRAIALWPALALIAVLTVLGATFGSAGVEATVGHRIVSDRAVTIPSAIVIVLAAGALTTLYNYWKVPTSTIQILVFCVVGTALAGGIPIYWGTIGTLALVWVSAPMAAFALGFAFTRLLDLIVPPAAARAQIAALAAPRAQIAALAAPPTESAVPATEEASWLVRLLPGVARAWTAGPDGSALAPKTAPRATQTALRVLPALLVLVGIGASFVLGANDVANATGAFILTHRFSLTVAGLIGGLAMAVGALTWGRRILRTVAFDIVQMDLTMASAAQGVQALVVITAVSFGLFTSMNQALIGAMAGTGLARGRETVRRAQIAGILRGWLIGPLSGLALACALEALVRFVLRIG